MARAVKKTNKAEAKPVKEALLVEHPDLFHMIVQYVDTNDLITLSKTCPVFWSTLMKKRSSYIWKAARGNLQPEGFPDCPEDTSEVVYALFVFGSQCHGCRGCIKNQKFRQELGLRLCEHCWVTGTSLADPEYDRRVMEVRSTDPLKKCVMYRLASGFRFGRKFYARRDQLLELRGGLAAVEAAYEGEDRERKVKAYLERAEEACRVKKEHATLLADWLRKAKAAEA